MTRTVAMGTMAVALALGGCAKERGVIQKSATTEAPASATGAPAAGAAAAQGEEGAAVNFTGAIVETMDASSYTYVHLKAVDGAEAWVAGPKATVSVGQVLTIKGGFEMKNFKSSALDRTFEKLIMVSSLGAPAAAAKAEGEAPAAPAPAAVEGSPHGDMSGSPHGMGVGGDAGKQAPGAPSVPSAVAAGSVAKAEGDTGRTVSEVYAQAGDLNGKPVAVRGVVVKASHGIMGHNWLHIQDGTGAAATGDHDLTLTTDGTAAVGDRVLITGTLAADRDFGAGYRYKAIVEEAAVTVEAPAAAPTPAP